MTNPMEMMIYFANVLCPKAYAIHALTAVLTITAIMMVIVAVVRAISSNDATVNVIASTSVNQEKNATKYKLSAGK